MKVLLIAPGASISTVDCYTGIKAGLEHWGVEVIPYHLDVRIDYAGRYLTNCWRWTRDHLRRRAEAEGLSRAEAIERAKRELGKPNQADIAMLAAGESLTRALYHEVDWTIVMSGMFYPADMFILFRKAKQKLALILSESPYEDSKQARIARNADIVWTNDRGSIPYLQQFNPNTGYLPHAYNPAVHNVDATGADDTVESHQVVFVGTGFEERAAMLGGVDWTGIDFGLYGPFGGVLGSRAKLRRHIRAEYVDNRGTAALYRKAKIGINLYRTSVGFGRNTPKVAYAESLSPRAYELAATGCFHLSEWRAELPEFFPPGLVPTFKNPAELQDLLAYWLPRDAERAAIARALPSTIAGHTWIDRAAHVATVLEDAMNTGRVTLAVA